MAQFLFNQYYHAYYSSVSRGRYDDPGIGERHFHDLEGLKEYVRMNPGRKWLMFLKAECTRDINGLPFTRITERLFYQNGAWASVPFS